MAKTVTPPPPPGFELVGAAPPPPPGFKLVQQEKWWQKPFLDASSGVARTWAGIGNAEIAVVNKLGEMASRGQGEPVIPPGSTQEAYRDVGINPDRERNLAGITGEFLAIPGGVGAKSLMTTVVSAAGARAAGLLFPGNPTAEVLGALSPFGLAPAMSAFTRGAFRGADSAKMQQRLADMDAVGMKPTVGSASGRPTTQALEATVASLPGGHGQVKAVGFANNAAMEGEIQSLAGGANRDTVIAGNTIKTGLFGKDGWINSTFRANRDKLYSALDSKLAGTASPATNTLNYLTSANKGVPGAPQLSANQFIDKEMQGLADDFLTDIQATGGLPYDAVKRLRTKVGDKLADPELIGSETRKMYSELYGELTKDMEAAATSAGAAKEFAAANRYNKLGMGRIDDFFNGISNKVTPEEVYLLAIGKSPSSATKLFKIKNSLTPEEWSTVRETVLNRMGRAKPNTQTDEYVFSAETFLTSYNNLKDNPRVLDALFGTTKSPFRKDLDTIARTASYMRESSKVLANPSGSAGLGLQASVLFGALGGAGNMALGSMAGVTAGAAVPGVVSGVALGTTGSYGLGKLLTNESFVRWLAQSTKLPAQSLPGHIKRLAILSQTNPEISAELEQYAENIKGYNALPAAMMPK
jgi:hypothetical protein